MNSLSGMAAQGKASNVLLRQENGRVHSGADEKIVDETMERDERACDSAQK